MAASGRRIGLYGKFDSGPGIFAFFIFAGIAFWMASKGIHPPAIIAAAIYIGSVIGFLLGGYRMTLGHDWVAARCGLLAEDFRELGECEVREGHFLTLCALAITCYIAFYAWAASIFAAPVAVVATASVPVADLIGDSPIPWYIVLITTVMVGVLSACSCRYAAYMRMATMLQEGLDKGMRADDRLITRLRKCVFRMEQLYEPPGNIFVTIGITATFLGLATGLVTLDLFSFFPVKGEVDGDTTLRSARAIASLRGFVGCMGLALGLSMLGVLTSMFAQWLRGYGPSESTEALLDRATKPLSAAVNEARAHHLIERG